MIIRYAKFTLVFIKSLIKSNIEVAKIVLSKNIDIDPAIVKLHTNCTNEFDKLLVANAITLTPGTITIKLEDQSLYVHLLDLKDKNKDQLQKEIVDNFEDIILLK